MISSLWLPRPRRVQRPLSPCLFPNMHTSCPNAGILPTCPGGSQNGSDWPRVTGIYRQVLCESSALVSLSSQVLGVIGKNIPKASILPHWWQYNCNSTSVSSENSQVSRQCVFQWRKRSSVRWESLIQAARVSDEATGPELAPPPANRLESAEGLVATTHGARAANFEPSQKHED